MAKDLQVDGAVLNTGLKVMQGIAGFQPYSSISFLATENIVNAVEEASELVDWGMAKNMHKMKETALDIMDHITGVEPGEPVNLNLDEYELKSISAVAELIEKTLEDNKDGVQVTNLPED